MATFRITLRTKAGRRHRRPSLAQRFEIAAAQVRAAMQPYRRRNRSGSHLTGELFKMMTGMPKADITQCSKLQPIRSLHRRLTSRD
jgi:hypothetical protein